MNYKESDILYESKNYWVRGTENSYEVYKIGLTHSTRCAIIGKSLGLNRAIEECLRRENKESDQ